MNYQLISQCPLFSGIPIYENEKLFGQVNFQMKKFEKNEIVVCYGDKVTHLLIIVEGSVKGEMTDYSGKTVKIEDIEAPRPLAAAFIFGKENNYPVTVIANNAVKILAIPIPEFLKMLQLSTKLLKNYMYNISTRAQFLSQKLHFLSFKTIKEKMAHFLLQQCGERLHSIELKNTQQQLADLFGVARPSLARVFSEMQQGGLIKIEKRTVTLLDKPALNELLKNG
jgi:CRP-like cAMP-binding protein